LIGKLLLTKNISIQRKILLKNKKIKLNNGQMAKIIFLVY